MYHTLFQNFFGELFMNFGHNMVLYRIIILHFSFEYKTKNLPLKFFFNKRIILVDKTESI